MYNPHYKPNQLICGSGQIAIITGWTVKQAVANKLTPDVYAVIGNLYSPTRGISFLIRNLLLNPQVRYLVILNSTKEDKNSGSCQCLLDFFAQGFSLGKSETDRECWLINSSITGYIDYEISSAALETLRKSIKYQEVQSISECLQVVEKLAKEKTESWGEPLSFPIVENIPTVLPGNRYGHRIEGKTIAQVWVKILQRIKTTGTIRPTGYDGKWQELINLMAIVTDEPEEFYFPEPNYLPIEKEFLKEYISQILDDAPINEGVKYTYGQRLRSWFGFDQIEQVIEKLKAEIDSASAVMSLWDVKDHFKGGSPCLNHLWLRVIDNEMSLTATLRSNDMFAAWPANAMGLRALQLYILKEINKRSTHNLQLGPLITISQSAHIYDDTWENVEKILANQYPKISREILYDDPVGNFLIELEDEQISLKQTTPGSGEIVATYQGTHPLKLIRELAANVAAIQPQHIGYLGIELQKAADCLKNNRQYIQDK